MKLLPISLTILVCLSVVRAEKTAKNVSLIDDLDLVSQSKSDTSELKTPDAQRKRDSGYSYVRSDELSSSKRHEPIIIRGRIVTKRPAGQTVRPFTTYGPPRNRQQPVVHHNRHQQQDVHISINEFPTNPSNTRQRVPSPMRDYEFVEASSIAGQNNVPFNSNAANYLPPRNQKLPDYSRPYGFVNSQQSTRLPNDHRNDPTRNRDQQQSLNHQRHQESQSHRQQSFHHQAQISDGATFLSQNSQAIAQLYEAPASNANYEPIYPSDESLHVAQTTIGNYQNYAINNRPTAGTRRFPATRDFSNGLPSYASGILERGVLRDVQSLEKDRLISQLQLALADQGKHEIASANAFGYPQNHEDPNYAQNLLANDQNNDNPGPQLDKPRSINVQTPYGTATSGFNSFLPAGSTTTSGFTYGLPTTTPSTGQQSTTLETLTTPSATQRPRPAIIGEASSQPVNALPATSNFQPLPTFQFPHYGGFVPSLVGTNLFTNYPTYGTNFFPSDSSTFNNVQSSLSSPTHFGIPIPTLPAAPGISLNPLPVEKPNLPPNNPHHGTPIQPVNSISAPTSIQPTFPLVPAVTQIHSLQTPAGILAQSSYGPQSAIINPLVKPIKGLYPVYYYPNVYQIQKPGIATVPWNYAPSYSQTRPAGVWK